MRILITIAYNGKDFCGWQVQTGRPSIQGEIILAIERLTGERVGIVGSGRTDAGVHALCQCAHFDLEKPFNVGKIANGLNFYLPHSIRIISAKEVLQSFHARRSAKKKTYLYKMHISDYDNPLMADRSLRLCRGIDVESMKLAARMFEGRHDFSAFMSSGSSVKTTTRTVFKSRITKKGSEIELKITADGFLYNMVRRIVAVLISIGTGKRSIDCINKLLSPPYAPLRDVAPAHGLYLLKVVYSNSSL